MSGFQPPGVCLLAVCMSSPGRCLFGSFVHFSTLDYLVLLLSGMSSLYSLDVNPFADTRFADIFSYVSIIHLSVRPSSLPPHTHMCTSARLGPASLGGQGWRSALARGALLSGQLALLLPTGTTPARATQEGGRLQTNRLGARLAGAFREQLAAGRSLVELENASTELHASVARLLLAIAR